MTTATMALAGLAEIGTDIDVLRQMVQFMAQRLMELDVDRRCGAGYVEKTPERLNSRNGYRDRTWDTPAGSVEPKIPKLRQGSYFPEFLEPRRTAEEALTAVIKEAYIQGFSTRSVDELVKALGMGGVSKRQVSRLCGEFDERVGAFLNRQIEGAWPYLWIDATYVKTSEAGRIVRMAVIVAVDVNTEGQREVLSLKVGASEADSAWTEFLRSLNRRGLRGFKPVTSYSHEDINAATAKVHKASWQRCRVHFMRNALAHAGKTRRRMVSAAIGTVFVQESADTARAQWRSVDDQLRGKFPELGALMDGAGNDVLAFMTCPRAHWTQIYSTDPLERLNAEIKRGSRVVGIFPNDASITRLLGATMLEQNDEWRLNRRYMQLEGLQPSAILFPLDCPLWLAELRAPQLFWAVDLHHALGHDRTTNVRLRRRQSSNGNAQPAAPSLFRPRSA